MREVLALAKMGMIDHYAICHCGVLTVRYRTALAKQSWPVRACQCSFCRGRGALTTSDPNGEIEFATADRTQLQRYRFGTRTTDFMLCQTCGSYLGAQTQTEMGRFGIINLRYVQVPSGDWPPPQTMDYSAETLEARRARREARWTPVQLSSL
jgi:hypothetical protein